MNIEIISVKANIRRAQNKNILKFYSKTKNN